MVGIVGISPKKRLVTDIRWWVIRCWPVTDVGPCQDDFYPVPNYILSNFNDITDDWLLIPGVTTERGCMSACRGDSNCGRFLLVTDPQLVGAADRRCYLIRARKVEFLERSGGTLYFRRKCVPLAPCQIMTTPSERRLFCSNLLVFL